MTSHLGLPPRSDCRSGDGRHALRRRWHGSRATVIATALVGGGLAGLALAQRPGRPVGPASESAAGTLWISTTPLDDGRQMLLVVDASARAAAVYHVEAATGALSLKSTRNLTWDLLVGEFNAGEPRPSAVRRMVEQDAPPR